MFRKIGAILQSLKASPEEVEEAYNSVYDNANRCIHCDAVMPEGEWECPNCKEKAKDSHWKSAFMNTFLGGKIK